MDGQFIDPDYVGKEIYVRVAEGYSLAQYRPSSDTGSSHGSQTSSEMAAAADSTEQLEPMSEFGPLVDSGVGYFENGEVRSWYCAKLFVKPTVAGSDYRLRCDKQMRRE